MLIYKQKHEDEHDEVVDGVFTPQVSPGGVREKTSRTKEHLRVSVSSFKPPVGSFIEPSATTSSVVAATEPAAFFLKITPLPAT
mmetsp:Transcript_386/g.790  ORF Transcript_386/g.790 Transcript_386/m.790 type:complete len:84 (+) Transcript_386:147-398(+)